MARKPSAHAELEELRQAAAREAAGRREAEVAVGEAQAALHRLEAKLRDAYYRDQSSEAAKLRKSRPDLEGAVEDAELRLAAATRRDIRAGKPQFGCPPGLLSAHVACPN